MPMLDRLDRPEMCPTALDRDRESSELADLAAEEEEDEELSELTEENKDTPLDLSDKFLLFFTRTAGPDGTS